MPGLTAAQFAACVVLFGTVGFGPTSAPPKATKAQAQKVAKKVPRATPRPRLATAQPALILADCPLPSAGPLPHILLSPIAPDPLFTAAPVLPVWGPVGGLADGGTILDPWQPPLLPPAIGVPVIPEPATWALLISGFGLVGAALRRTPPRRPA